jgi:NitT/TauT family transport system ATP-binding protein
MTCDISSIRRPKGSDANGTRGENVKPTLANQDVYSSGQQHPGIELSGVTKRFLTPAGSAFTALRDVNMGVEPGQFCAVVGPSGCGKSTTLTMVAGLDRPSAGTVRVDDREVDGITKGTSFMFQADALLPWKTVLGNVAMGPIFRGTSKKEAEASAREWLRVVGLTGFEKHHPHQLSGGMRKRVSLAAALITEPSILLMDEPFGALDALTRGVLHGELERIWRERGVAVLFVTHDVREAVRLGDRVVVLGARPGRILHDFPVTSARPRDDDRAAADLVTRVTAALRVPAHD